MVKASSVQLWQVSDRSVSVCLIVSSWWLSIGSAHLGWFQSCWRRESFLGKRDGRGQSLLCLLFTTPLRGCRPLAVRVGNEPSGLPASMFWVLGVKALCSVILLILAHIAGTLNKPLSRWVMRDDCKDYKVWNHLKDSTPSPLQHTTTFPHPPLFIELPRSPYVYVSGAPHSAQPSA